MTVLPLVPAPAGGALPDEPLAAAAQGSAGTDSFANALGKAYETAGGALENAARTERAFSARRGGLQEMVLERAKADVALSVASATASRVSQALATILGMQI